MDCSMIGSRVAAFLWSIATRNQLLWNWSSSNIVLSSNEHNLVNLDLSTPTPRTWTGFCRKCSAQMSRTKFCQSTKVCSVIANSWFAVRKFFISLASNGVKDRSYTQMASLKKRSWLNGRLVVRPATPPTKHISLPRPGLIPNHGRLQVGQTSLTVSKPWSLAHCIAATFVCTAAWNSLSWWHSESCFFQPFPHNTKNTKYYIVINARIRIYIIVTNIKIIHVIIVINKKQLLIL